MFSPLFGPLRNIRVSLTSSWIQRRLQLSHFTVNITQSLLTASFISHPHCERLRPSSRNRWLPSLNQWITPAAVSQSPNRSQTSRRVPSAKFTVLDYVSTDMEQEILFNRHNTLLFQGFFLSSSPSVSTWVELCQGLIPPCLSKGWDWSPPCCTCLQLKAGNTGVTFWLVHFQLTAPAASSVLVQHHCKYSKTHDGWHMDLFIFLDRHTGISTCYYNSGSINVSFPIKKSNDINAQLHLKNAFKGKTWFWWVNSI